MLHILIGSNIPMWSQYSKLRFGYNVGQWWMTSDVSLRIIIFTSYGKNVKYQVCLWKKCYANIMHNTVKYYREQTHTRPLSYWRNTPRTEKWKRKLPLVYWMSVPSFCLWISWRKMTIRVSLRLHRQPFYLKCWLISEVMAFSYTIII